MPESQLSDALAGSKTKRASSKHRSNLTDSELEERSSRWAVIKPMILKGIKESMAGSNLSDSEQASCARSMANASSTKLLFNNAWSKDQNSEPLKFTFDSTGSEKKRYACIYTFGPYSARTRATSGPDSKPGWTAETKFRRTATKPSAQGTEASRSAT